MRSRTLSSCIALQQKSKGLVENLSAGLYERCFVCCYYYYYYCFCF